MRRLIGMGLFGVGMVAVLLVPAYAKYAGSGALAVGAKVAKPVIDVKGGGSVSGEVMEGEEMKDYCFSVVNYDLKSGEQNEVAMRYTVKVVEDEVGRAGAAGGENGGAGGSDGSGVVESGTDGGGDDGSGSGAGVSGTVLQYEVKVKEGGEWREVLGEAGRYGQFDLPFGEKYEQEFCVTYGWQGGQDEADADWGEVSGEGKRKQNYKFHVELEAKQVTGEKR